MLSMGREHGPALASFDIQIADSSWRVPLNASGNQSVDRGSKASRKLGTLLRKELGSACGLDERVDRLSPIRFVTPAGPLSVLALVPGFLGAGRQPRSDRRLSSSREAAPVEDADRTTMSPPRAAGTADRSRGRMTRIRASTMRHLPCPGRQGQCCTLRSAAHRSAFPEENPDPSRIFGEGDVFG